MFRNIINLLNDVTVSICQLLAMLVILIGVLRALYVYVKDIWCNKRALEAIAESRLETGHAFSLGLAFLIGASILKSIIAPTWNDIGQLTAIIGIRTALNYFLLKDVKNLSVEMNLPQENVTETPPSPGSAC